MVSTTLQSKVDPPGSREIRVAFLALWTVDTAAALSFFLVPHVTELNPITVYLYQLFGLPGVAVAAFTYLGVIVGIGNLLPDPLDSLFITAVTALYVAFSINNIVLLAFGTGPIAIVV